MSTTKFNPNASVWQAANPPKDGRSIVAMGRVIYKYCPSEDDADSPNQADLATVSEPFLLQIYWKKTDSGYEGWLRVDDDMSVAQQLEDRVYTDFWIEPPTRTTITAPLSADDSAAVQEAAKTPATVALAPAVAGQPAEVA